MTKMRTKRKRKISESSIVSDNNLTLQAFPKKYRITESGNSPTSLYEFEGIAQLEKWMANDKQKSSFKSCNPLQNHLVLGLIFQNLKVDDLRSCRLVCRLWNAEAKPYFQERAILDIDMTSKQSGRTAEDFLSKVMQNPDAEFPCNNLRLTATNLHDPETVILFELFGYHIKTLILDAVASTADTEEKFCKKHILRLSQQCPNLESLDLINLPDHLIDKGFPKLMKAVMQSNNFFSKLKRLSFEATGYFCPLDGQFIMDFMDFSPNLTELSFSVGDDDALDEVMAALELRSKFMEQIQVLKFGNDFGNTLFETHIQTLMDLRLSSLRELVIGSLGADVTAETFKYFLEELSPTLEVLKIGDLAKTMATRKVSLRLRFPEMNKLNHLEINDIGGIRVGSIRFLRKFCNLRTCILNRSDGILAVMNFMEDQKFWASLFPNDSRFNMFRHFALEKLVVPKHLNNMEIVMSIKEYFPSLKYLTLDLDSDELLSGVIEHLKESRIEELFLNIVPTGFAFDSGLSGIPSADCETIAENRTYWPVSPKSRWKVWSSLADWKSLRKLSIISRTSDYFHISGVAVCHGLALAKNITSLELGNFSIRDVFILELMHKMLLSKLKLQSCKVIPSVWGGSTGIAERVKLFFPLVDFEFEPPAAHQNFKFLQ